MDKRKVRKFKNQQKRLAKRIAEAYGISNFTIDYEQKIPSAYRDWETGKIIIGENSQYIFPTAVIYKGKSRVIVVMRFYGTCNSERVGKILQRQFLIKTIENGFEVRSSFNPHTIANFKI